VHIQDQRLNWTMMAAVFAMMLSTVAGGILIWEVQKNAGILAGMNKSVEQLKSSLGQPLPTIPATGEQEPADLPDVVTPIEQADTNQPAENRLLGPHHVRPVMRKIPEDPD
jgi:hypothetical protein